MKEISHYNPTRPYHTKHHFISSLFFIVYMSSACMHTVVSYIRYIDLISLISITRTTQTQTYLRVLNISMRLLSIAVCNYKSVFDILCFISQEITVTLKYKHIFYTSMYKRRKTYTENRFIVFAIIYTQTPYFFFRCKINKNVMWQTWNNIDVVFVTTPLLKSRLYFFKYTNKS